MTNILHIESSHSQCSVSLSGADELIYYKTSGDSKSHHQVLPVLIDEALQILSPHSLSAVHLCSGPGSYTGLRIGFSIVKGLAYGYEIPIILSSSNELIFEYAKGHFEHSEVKLIYTGLQARPNEVYAQMFDLEANKNLGELIVQPMDESFDLIRKKYFGNKIAIIGNGLNTEGLYFNNSISSEGILPNSNMMINLGLNKWESEKFEDLMTCSPLYLKPPRVIRSKKKLFG